MISATTWQAASLSTPDCTHILINMRSVFFFVLPHYYFVFLNCICACTLDYVLYFFNKISKVCKYCLFVFYDEFLHSYICNNNVSTEEIGGKKQRDHKLNEPVPCPAFGFILLENLSVSLDLQYFCALSQDCSDCLAWTWLYKLVGHGNIVHFWMTETYLHHGIDKY